MFNLGTVRGEDPAVLTQNAPVLLENMITSGTPYVKTGNYVLTTKSTTAAIFSLEELVDFLHEQYTDCMPYWRHSKHVG
jgi:hypothetical protein